MAQINLTINYPDGKGPDLVAALNDHYGQVEDGVDGDGNPVFRDRTSQELIQLMETGVRNSIQEIYAKYRQKTHNETINPSEKDLGAT